MVKHSLVDATMKFPYGLVTKETADAIIKYHERKRIIQDQIAKSWKEETDDKHHSSM